jgi:2-alkyl-3-oxoalkanoate reductase
MRVAVTGASGFVGGYIAGYLQRAGYDVHAYGRRAAASLRHPVPKYAAWDFTNGPTRAPNVDAVVHCAAMVGDCGPLPAFRAANVAGTLAAAATFQHASRFIHISTASVYNLSLPLRGAREDAPCGGHSFSPYAQSKLEGERQLSAIGRPVTILRPHIIYGPGDSTLMPRVLAALRGGRLPLPGTGRNRLSVTHVDNLAQAVRRALDGPVESGVFNVADACEVTLDELARVLLRRYGVVGRVVYIPGPVAWHLAAAAELAARVLPFSRPPFLTRFVVRQLTRDFTLDVSLARAVLGYAPRWTVHDGPLGEGVA